MAEPEYTAVRLWLPEVLKLVVSVALPELSVAVPSVVLPLLKVMVPVAVLGETVALSTVFAPTLTGFTEEVRLVLLLSRFTVCVRALEVLVATVDEPE